MKIGFDLISDLNLKPDDSFNWENKATSLYCLVAGNVSSDTRTIAVVLNHLAKFYQGVFYTPGSLEFEGVENYEDKIKEIERLCKRIRNVALLHHHVVVIDGVAVLGCTGRYGNENDDDFEATHKVGRFDDLVYLNHSIQKLQRHLDVRKIVLLTHAVPKNKLYFGQEPSIATTMPELEMALASDSESKVSHWVYGSYEKIVDTTIDNINYVCNPYYGRKPYWAKRIEVEI